LKYRTNNSTNAKEAEPFSYSKYTLALLEAIVTVLCFDPGSGLFVSAFHFPPKFKMTFCVFLRKTLRKLKLTRNEKVLEGEETGFTHPETDSRVLGSGTVFAPDTPGCDFLPSILRVEEEQ
jgi:hypothetical protein